jgi:VWFA-related protein
MISVWIPFLLLFSTLGLQQPAQWQEKPPADQQTQESDKTKSQDDQDQDQGFRIGVAVNQVFLSINARSVNGGFVQGLTEKDFMVFEDGRLQKIVNFYSEKVPVKVVLLIDASGSTRYSQADIRNAALEFVKRLNPDDQVAVVTFNAQAKLILDFTNKFDDVKLALDSIYARGNTVLNDALYVTFDDLLADEEGKTAVILLTDGIDTGSMTSFDESVNLALRSDTMVYIVSKVDEYRAAAIQLRQEMQSRLQPVPKELQDDYIRERKVELRRLANLSGGRLLDTSDFYSLTNIYQQVADELRNQYYLSYVPTNQDRDGGWRSVDVKVSRGGVVVSTRKGYFAPGSLPTAR